MSSEKYKMFSQFMSNELGITKDDIKEWVKESAEDTITRLMNQQYEKFDINAVVFKALSKLDIMDSKRQLNYQLRADLADRLCDKILEEMYGRKG